MPDYTLEQLDQALTNARERDANEEEIALLWAARAALLGLGISAASLQLVMGVSEERALDLMASLSEKGFVDYDDEPKPT